MVAGALHEEQGFAAAVGGGDGGLDHAFLLRLGGQQQDARADSRIGHGAVHRQAHRAAGHRRIGFAGVVEHAKVKRQLAMRGRQHRRHRGFGGGRELRQRQAVRFQRVGQQRAAAARAREDRRAVRGGALAALQQLGTLQQVVDVLEQVHPPASASGLEGRPGAGQAGGVRGGRLGAGFAAPGLGDAHRLAGGSRARQQRREARCVLDALHVQADDVGLRVVDQVLEEVVQVHVGLVAYRHRAREAGADVHAARDHGAHQRTTLAGQADATARQFGQRAHHHTGGGAQVVVGVHQAHAVGTDQPHAAGARQGHQGFFLGTAFRASLGEAGRDAQRAAHALGHAVFHRGAHVLARHQEDGQVHRARTVAHRLVGRQAQQFGGAGVDGVERAVVPVPQHVAQQATAPFGFVVGGADDGDAARVQDLAYRLVWRRHHGCRKGCVHGGRYPINSW